MFTTIFTERCQILWRQNIIRYRILNLWQHWRPRWCRKHPQLPLQTHLFTAPKTIFLHRWTQEKKEFAVSKNKERKHSQNENGKLLSEFSQRFLTGHKLQTWVSNTHLWSGMRYRLKVLLSLCRAVLKVGSKEPKPISGDLQSQTTFIIILRCYLPFSLSFLQKCSVSFPEDMWCDIATDWMQKQVRESNRLLLEGW